MVKSAHAPRFQVFPCDRLKRTPLPPRRLKHTRALYRWIRNFWLQAP